MLCRHVGTSLDLTDQEGAAVIKAAREVAQALLATYEPLGILTFQNNGVYRARVDTETLQKTAAQIRRNMPA
jgi:diadenosine tetraphosphate (Ap4A) HIT family hydrolase